MYSSLLVAVQEKELLILENEFFLEHQYQRDEPGKKKAKKETTTITVMSTSQVFQAKNVSSLT